MDDAYQADRTHLVGVFEVAARAEGSTSYAVALDLAARDMVAAFQVGVDPATARHSAREVTAWLSDLYGRTAIRDLAEHLAERLAAQPATPAAPTDR